MENVPSGVGFIMMSKKGIAPSGLVSFTVNLIALSMELMGFKNLSLVFYVLYHRSVIYIFFHGLGGFLAVLRALFTKSLIHRLATKDLTGDSRLPFPSFIVLPLKKKIPFDETELHCVMCCTDILVQ